MMITTGAKEAEIASGLTGTTVNWVDNLAGLRAMAHATTAPVVVKGYGSAGDGGGGIFLWNDTSTLADNDGTGRMKWRPHPPAGGSGSTPDRST